MSANQLAMETFYVMPTPSLVSTTSPLQFCIFCLKNESKNDASPKKVVEESGKSALQERFLEMLSKYFEEKRLVAGGGGGDTEAQKICFPFSSGAEEMQVTSCAECFSKIELYCDIYDRIKCLKMQLDWTVDKLNKAMKCADEDISKLCAFHDWCHVIKGGKTEAVEFRRQFQRQCELNNLTCFPQVPLRRVCTRRALRLDKVENEKNLKKGRLSFSENRTKSSFEPSSERENYPFINVETPNAKSSEFLDDDLFNSDQYQDESLLSAVIKEEISNDFNDDVASPINNYGDDEIDPDWFESDDDDEDYRKKGSKKRKSTGKAKSRRTSKRIKTSKKKSLQAKVTNSSTEKFISCQKCQEVPKFYSVTALQVHQKYLHSNGFEMLSSTENSEVLRLNEGDLKLLGFQVTLHACSDHFPECPQTFWSLKELNNHLEYHEDISCETCGIAKSNAVDMAQHEISQHKGKTQPAETKCSIYKTTCGKCEYSTAVEGELINHYLQLHMNKPAIQTACPICQQQFKFVEKTPLLHYLNYHDLARLEDPSSTGIKCVEDNCPAYFLTEDQLQQHRKYMHGKKSLLMEVVSEEKRLQAVAIKTKQKATRYKSRGFVCSCEFCEKSFRAENEVRAHTWRFHADQKWGASCGKIQLTKDGLTIDEFGIGKKCVCDICENVLSSTDQLEKHKLHHGEFKCNFCDIVKTLATELAIHETVHNIEGKGGHSAGTFKCPRCSFSTKRRPEYIDHFLESHLSLSSDRKKCPICRKPVPDLLKTGLGKLGQRNWMVGHYMEVHDKTGLDADNMQNCHLCDGYFRTPVQLDNHYREIHGKHRYECRDCGKVYDKRIRLQRHRISAHKVDPTTFPFVCSFPDCGYRFETQVELGHHEKGAHSEKDVAVQFCPQCGKQCSGTSQLISHMKTHERNANKKKLTKEFSDSLVCEECGKAFTIKKSLRRHRQRHEIKRNGGIQVVKKKVVKAEVKVESDAPSESFVCEQCGKSFKTIRQLYSHRFKHKGPEFWNFSCSECSKRFSTRYKLTLHMRRHTKEKPFVCELCNSTFGFPQNLQAHIKSKHKDVESSKLTVTNV